MGFTHLHLHTEYSLLDGMVRIQELPEYIKSMGMDAVAITDHGAMFGVIDFYKACKAASVKPIIGCEVYTARRTRFDKDYEADRKSGHLILLAENQTGYQNLIKIVSKSYTEGLYYKPRVDKELLKEYSEGLICLSGCMVGDVARLLLEGNYEGARTEALSLQAIFGQDNFFLEAQNHGLPDDMTILEGLRTLSQEIGAPIVATNDAHYMRREDAANHDVLLCIQTKSLLEDQDRMRFPNDQFYVKSEDEMRALFPEIPEAIDITEEIASRCNVEFEFGNYHLPQYDPPDGLSSKEYLTKLCRDGLASRYGESALEPDSLYRKRLDMELSVIENMGFVDYFLIVWDFIHYAKSNGIDVGPGRGSAAGSIVAYSLRITEIDPIKYNLLFERFLNPERISMPDIDVDFCIERRGEVIDYVTRKYGKEQVSQIITFGTLKARAAVKDVARALNVPYADSDALAKMIPFDLSITIEQALRESPELKARYDREPLVKAVLDTAQALEGLPKNASTHAAGVVISGRPLDDYVPLYLSDKGLATQFNMTTIEELGLLKMDFLGLRNLTIIRNAINLIEQNQGKHIDFYSMGYDDPEVYKMIQEGNTKGVFQLESSGMTEFMISLKPSCFEDIVAGIALYRPGPMDSIPTYINNKQHPESIKYIDPHLEPILNVTYGCLIYQEQVMQIVRELGGYSYGRSDLVRRAMSKKKMSVMLEEKEIFINGQTGPDGEVLIDGALRRNISRDAATQIFDEMVSFASYAFNKSHAAAYAIVAYQTAYLKRHYPTEFMAALLSSVSGRGEQVAKYIANCQEMGIKCLPPSVLYSDSGFTTNQGNIRFGLSSIKNVGEGLIESIIRARQNKQEFKDLFDFLDALDPHEINKKSLLSLIQAGALDDIDPNRARCIAIHEEAIARMQRIKAKSSENQISLFQMEGVNLDEAKPHMPDVINFSDEQALALEKEVLGVYLSGHPLDKYLPLIKKISNVDTSKLVNSFEEEESQEEINDSIETIQDKQDVRIVGIVNNIRTMMTKNGQQMARIDLEVYEGLITMIVFPRVFDKARSLFVPDQILVVNGSVNVKDQNNYEIIVNDVKDIHSFENMDDFDSYLKIKITEEVLSKYGGKNQVLNRIINMCSAYKGKSKLLVYMPDGTTLTSDKVPLISFQDDLRETLVNEFGEDNIKLSSK